MEILKIEGYLLAARMEIAIWPYDRNNNIINDESLDRSIVIFSFNNNNNFDRTERGTEVRSIRVTFEGTFVRRYE